MDFAFTDRCNEYREKLCARSAPPSVRWNCCAGGLSDDWPLAQMYAHQRTLRLAEGPDEVHKMTIARRELRRHDPDFRM